MPFAYHCGECNKSGRSKKWGDCEAGRPVVNDGTLELPFFKKDNRNNVLCARCAQMDWRRRNPPADSVRNYRIASKPIPIVDLMDEQLPPVAVQRPLSQAEAKTEKKKLARKVDGPPSINTRSEQQLSRPLARSDKAAEQPFVPGILTNVGEKIIIDLHAWTTQCWKTPCDYKDRFGLVCGAKLEYVKTIKVEMLYCLMLNVFPERRASHAAFSMRPKASTMLGQC
jgi:hypothetical protein